MPGLQDQYDEAMFIFTEGDYDRAIALFRVMLEQDPENFDAQLSLGMAYYRKGDYAQAIAEGHRAEQLRPQEQLVHTNLSLFYQKQGNKTAAEHHGLKARIASWKTQGTPGAVPGVDPDLAVNQAAPAPAPAKPVKFPDMPWKKTPKATANPGDSSKPGLPP
jgi:tetratricopeptide (TPR) repeat protein